MKYLVSVRCTESDHNINFFKFSLRLGENNMRALHILEYCCRPTDTRFI